MSVCDVVVIGSYPPMPGPATAATLAAVRRAWDSGQSVRVVSFRPGAADISVSVAGPLAGWRLEHVRRHYSGPGHVVLVLQSGAPFSDRRYRQQLATATGLAIAMRRFPLATLVVGEDPEIPPACFRLLAAGAKELLVGTEGAARALSARYRLAPARFTVEEVEPYPPVPPGVEPETAGLYAPRGSRGLTLVTLPGTTLAQRVRARVPEPALVRRLRGR